MTNVNSFICLSANLRLSNFVLEPTLFFFETWTYFSLETPLEVVINFSERAYASFVATVEHKINLGFLLIASENINDSKIPTFYKRVYGGDFIYIYGEKVGLIFSNFVVNKSLTSPQYFTSLKITAIVKWLK